MIGVEGEKVEAVIDLFTKLAALLKTSSIAPQFLWWICPILSKSKPCSVPSCQLRTRARQAFREFTWGGEWAIALSEQIKHNLYWFFFDGLFSSAIDNIVVTYVTLYILALGATRAQVGLMSSFSGLSAALLLMPGAILVERYGHRKEFTLAFGGGGARLAVLGLALLPWFVQRRGDRLGGNRALGDTGFVREPGFPGLDVRNC